MAKTWILDSETKGTGAHMVPLEDALAADRSEPDLSLVTLRREPAPTSRQASPEPLKFKVVDVMSARVLAQDVSAREAVGVLETLRSVLDARIFVWAQSRGRWRLLSLDEQKALWEFRAQAPGRDAAVSA
jgi:hypothetical protein